MDVRGVRSPWERLAMKSRGVFSTRSVSVRSRSTATAPPPGKGAAVTSKARPGMMEVAREVVTCLASLASFTAARKSGSRMVSTTGACRRVRCGARRSMRSLAHCTRPSALTAMTASCMLLSRVSSWRWLERTAAKLCSTRRAVLSMAPATRPISSGDVSQDARLKVAFGDTGGDVDDALEAASAPDRGHGSHHQGKKKRQRGTELKPAPDPLGNGLDIGKRVRQTHSATGNRNGDIKKRSANGGATALIAADPARESRRKLWR